MELEKNNKNIMKKIILLLVFFSSLSIFANETLDMEEIFIFDTKVWHEVNLESNVNYIEVDSTDVTRIISILKNSKAKKRPIYKADGSSLYGITTINEEKYNIRISEDIIFIAYKTHRHFFLQNEEDKLWLRGFISKMSAKLACLNNRKE